MKSLLPFLAVLAGCATLLEGSEQTIHFNSTPRGASVAVLGRFGETPATMAVPKKPSSGSPADGTAPPVDLRISKPGYEDVHLELVYGVSEIGRWGNIANLGVGYLIDSSTGALYYLQTPDHTGYLTNVNVVLQPKSSTTE